MVKEESIFVVAEEEKACNEDVAFCIEEQLAYDEPELGVSPASEKEEEKEEGSWLETHDVNKFHDFLQAEMERIKSPMVARSSVSEMERAYSQWVELDRHVSKALRADYEGNLDVPLIDKQRMVIQYNINQLRSLLDGIAQAKKGRGKRAESEIGEIVKEANTPMYLGMQTNITLFETAIVRALINGVVSGGRNMEELYDLAKEKYDFTEREELAIFQALSDMGYPTFKDRLRIGDDDQDVSENLGEWQSQYYG
jgi:hypothetical protein